MYVVQIIDHIHRKLNEPKKSNLLIIDNGESKLFLVGLSLVLPPFLNISEIDFLSLFINDVCGCH